MINIFHILEENNFFLLMIFLAVYKFPDILEKRFNISVVNPSKSESRHTPTREKKVLLFFYITNNFKIQGFYFNCLISLIFYKKITLKCFYVYRSLQIPGEDEQTFSRYLLFLFPKENLIFILISTATLYVRQLELGSSKEL